MSKFQDGMLTKQLLKLLCTPMLKAVQLDATVVLPHDNWPHSSFAWQQMPALGTVLPHHLNESFWSCAPSHAFVSVWGMAVTTAVCCQSSGAVCKGYQKKQSISSKLSIANKLFDYSLTLVVRALLLCHLR